ncbi:hypothetical protein I4U23_004226 [Adineta vaga]|nr:hypothetical protein I4U23_004226 [Adineta vaga]
MDLSSKSYIKSQTEHFDCKFDTIDPNLGNVQLKINYLILNSIDIAQSYQID